MGSFAPAIAAALVPAASHALLVPAARAATRRAAATDPGAKLAVHGAFAAGLVSGAAIEGVGHALGRLAGVELHPHAASDGSALALGLIVLAPIAEASKVVAAAPAMRSRAARRPADGAIVAAAAALGFATIETFFVVRDAAAPGAAALREAAALAAHVFFAAVWGFFWGRDLSKGRAPGRSFSVAFLVATSLHGVYRFLAFGKGWVLFAGTAPLLVAMAITTWLVLRDVRAETTSSRGVERRSLLSTLPPPPSLGEMRRAMRHAEQPLMLGWVVGGALVTLGAIVIFTGLAVWLAQRAGLDFAALDDANATEAIAPLAMMGLGAVSAFPVAGYLVARASGTDSVIESALAAAIAIAVATTLLGLAAPVTLVFAVASAPIAFGLACVGAWLGMHGA